MTEPKPDYTWFMAYRDLMAARAEDTSRWQKLFDSQQDEIAAREEEIDGLKKTEEALRNEIKYLRKYYRYVPRSERGGEQDGGDSVARVGLEDQGLGTGDGVGG